MKTLRIIKWIVPVLVFAAAGCNPSGTQNRHAPAGEASGYFADSRTAKRVDSLMKLMTLDEKIGQLVLYTSHFTVTGPTLAKNVEEAIRNGTCGNIFNAHVPEYNRGLQKLAVEETRLGIPLLFGYDVIHGMRTIFPINLGMSCSWDMEGIRNSARVAAREAIASGVNWTFSPMVDVTRDPRWGRVSEGSGEDVYLGSRIAAAMVEGYQGGDLADPWTLAACVKHYAAYGAPQAGRDYQTVDITDRTLRDVYLPPYKAAVDAGVATVMTSFNDIDGIPATASKYLMDDILRGEWGFNGFVVTDYTSMSEIVPHGVARDGEHAAELAINAGVNMDMEGDLYHKYLKGLVEEEKVSKKQIDRMCADVLRIKFELGLFDDPYRYNDLEAAEQEFLKDEYRDAARDMARKSMVLLRNAGSTLPISGSARIALIGPFADSRMDLLGSWYGQGKAKDVTTILAGMQERFGTGNVAYVKGCGPDGDDRSGFAAAVNAARGADVAVMAVGHPGKWSGEATSLSFITIPKIQQELISEVRKAGKKVVLVLLNGRPLDLSWEAENADAIVEAWYPGTEGGRAVADVLSGDWNPSGKLTMTFPRTIGQVPIHYDMKSTGRPYTPGEGEQHYVSRYLDLPTNEPLFPFGFGLSYTSFEYSGIGVNSPAMKDGHITVSAIVKNTGSRAGDEVVQLYVRDMVGSVTRPVRMLKGFEKVSLGAGESREVSFMLTTEDLSFHRADMTWGTEPGEFRVWIGGSSDASLETSFTISE